MRGYMFMNRWGALIFVCLAAFGAVSLIGGEDDPGVLLYAAGELTQTRDKFKSDAATLALPDDRPVLDAATGGEFTPDEELETEFLPDEQLIDDTRGFEPAPDINPSPPNEDVEEQGDVVIYIEDE